MDSHDPQRRIVLRGTLATGITLMLGACDSKQPGPAAPRTSPAAAIPPQTPPAAPPVTAVAETAPGAKLTKAVAQYQTEPKGEQQCGNCAHFIAPNACRVVQGDISPDGWCTLWTKQA